MRTLVFDLDDTLVRTAPLYQAVLDRFLSILDATVPGPLDREEARRLQEDIDIRAIEEQGFARNRFPWSLAETYRVLMARRGASSVAAVERALEDLGYQVFETVPEPVEGAEALLRDLRAASYELLLYTLGAPEVQKAKIAHHGFDLVFHEVHVVERKTPERLAAVIGHRNPVEVMVVGDSLRGEVAPALALGCHAVLVRRPEPWRYHDAEVEGSYHTLDDVTGLRSLLGLSS